MKWGFQKMPLRSLQGRNVGSLWRPLSLNPDGNTHYSKRIGLRLFAILKSILRLQKVEQADLRCFSLLKTK
jgi:hypothetical protein